MTTLANNPDSSEFSAPFAVLFPVTGAAVSTLGDFLGSETLSASDETAARLDELQFDLGEGPCWDAMNEGNPVLITDVASSTRWPAFTEATQRHDIRSLFAFPVRVGSLRIGAVDLYSTVPVIFGTDQSRQAVDLAGVVGRRVLQKVLLDSNSEYIDSSPNAYSRRLIHQATGMVLAQLRLSADDARLVIQGHAFAVGQPMMEVAQAIVDGQLDFSKESLGPRDAHG